MGLTIIRQGFGSSVQDLGRFGYQKYGIIVGGAMDPDSAKTANWLVGNSSSSAVIEYSFLGPTVLFTEDTLFALTGASCRPKLDHQAIGMGRPCLAHEGQILEIGGLSPGSRGYLAVAGGIDTEPWLGSRSTYERAGRGGFKGRRLNEQDRLPVGSPSRLAAAVMKKLAAFGREKKAGWFFSWRRAYGKKQMIRVTPDRLWPKFSEESRRAFLQTDYRVTPASDRMGYRLSGAGLSLNQPLELYSEAVTNGSIQVPKNGQPIILLTDHQSTGGYPRIAQVAAVDLPIVAQLAPGSLLRFRLITVPEAERLYLEHRRALELLKGRISRKLED
ncbi:biotin-dependent carboxyltransferase family protein [Sporolactobacillus sp. THM7-7]|nr:biotin-dependent carboxyltransferase family protein [Sporolactobacillus sp. THM7-7]